MAAPFDLQRPAPRLNPLSRAHRSSTPLRLSWRRTWHTTSPCSSLASRSSLVGIQGSDPSLPAAILDHHGPRPYTNSVFDSGFSLVVMLFSSILCEADYLFLDLDSNPPRAMGLQLPLARAEDIL